MDDYTEYAEVEKVDSSKGSENATKNETNYPNIKKDMNPALSESPIQLKVTDIGEITLQEENHTPYQAFMNRDASDKITAEEADLENYNMALAYLSNPNIDKMKAEDPKKYRIMIRIRDRYIEKYSDHPVYIESNYRGDLCERIRFFCWECGCGKLLCLLFGLPLCLCLELQNNGYLRCRCCH